MPGGFGIGSQALVAASLGAHGHHKSVPVVPQAYLGRTAMQASARLIWRAGRRRGLAGAALDLRAGPRPKSPRAAMWSFCGLIRPTTKAARGTFAHHGKRAGDLSGYGEYCVLMLRHLAERDGRFSRVAYQTLFRKHFGLAAPTSAMSTVRPELTIQKTAAVRRPGELPAALGVKDDRLLHSPRCQRWWPAHIMRT